MTRFLPHAKARWTRRAAAAILVVAAGTLAACNILGPAGVLIAGPEKVPIVYELDEKRPTVVFIDDTRASVLPTRMVRAQIGKTAEEVLLNEGKMEHMIASQDLLAVADREKYSKALGIVELGQAVKAEVVIYVSMESFSLIQDAEHFQPKASARVRVIDVTTKKQLWPDKLDDAFTLQIDAPPQNGTPPKTVSERSKFQLEFAQRIGRSVAYMFVEHEKHPEPGKLDH